jgi:hypothetical protein
MGNPWIQDVVAAVITLAVALVWLRVVDALAARGVLEQRLSRKVIHIGTGPLFVACWLLFTPNPAARYLAALVPLLITGQFALVGTGLMEDPAAVAAMTRHGDRPLACGGSSSRRRRSVQELFPSIRHTPAELRGGRSSGPRKPGALEIPAICPWASPRCLGLIEHPACRLEAVRLGQPYA